MRISEDARAEIDALYATVGSWQRVGEQARALSPRAGALARVLQQPEFAENATRYRTHSDAASAAQTTQQRHTWRAGLFGFFAAGTAAVMLYLKVTPTDGVLGPFLGGVYCVCLAMAFWSALVINLRKPYRRWAEQRGAAEAARIRQFKMMLDAHEPHRGGEIPMLPLGLEYVRAYLMDDQRTWFAQRSAHFKRIVRRDFLFRIFGLVLVGLAAVPTIVAVFKWEVLISTLPQVAAWAAWLRETVEGNLFALAGVIGGALQTLITCLAAASLAERNATSYEQMVNVLDELCGEPLDEARAAAANNADAVVGKFWTALGFELIGEHREWGGALQTAQLLVLDRLGDIRHVKSA